ncbi:alanyl-tRNA editing protein, partial [Acidianus sp. RZ1]|uniref:alanyl-tRNA editing protein n=1 Tax=Acidianus sp. RZ1 TaxID=1540082 RepID=UPI001490BC06
MVEEIYLKDSYIREFSSNIVKVEGNKVFLDRTAFYPGGGGLENDIGIFEQNEKKVKVIEVKRENGDIAHVIDGEISLGPIKGIIDWERRYAMMKLHTASHVMAAIAYSKFNALVTGGHISPEYAKDDFNVDSKE